MKAFELNFDGMVGPTHNYSGLSRGNLASTQNKAQSSNPLEAVLQGLEKMKVLTEAGIPHAVLPPQDRPHIDTLRSLGFTGPDAKILSAAAKTPHLLAAVSNSSSMWTANAATVSPSADCRDRKIHFTAANLSSKFHRSIEAQITSETLRRIFKNSDYFVHHDPLAQAAALADEGAANHTRLCDTYSDAGLEFFVYGREGIQNDPPELLPKNFPARQTREASMAIARNHGLDSDHVVMARQNPLAVDGGVFHNDVVAVGNQNVFFVHESAYVDQAVILKKLQATYKDVCEKDLIVIEVRNSEVALDEAVKTYLFNSQLLTKLDGTMLLAAPVESRESPAVSRYVEGLLARDDHPIKEVRYFNLRQSMRNGGGPACLRLRVVLKEKELKAVNQKVLFNDRLYEKLGKWARKHYRDRLSIQDLADPSLLKEGRAALDALTQILGLGSLYSFQR